MTKEEKQSLGQLLDLAVKAGGLKVANSALYFVNKFELAEKPKEEKPKK